MTSSKAAGWATAVFLLVAPFHAEARISQFSFNGLFGSVEFAGNAPPQWLEVILRLRADRQLFDACMADPDTCLSSAVREWLHEIRQMRALPPLTRIDALNRAVNRWAYKSDYKNFQRPDYWATPSEFMQRSGDCEDYVIFKMFSLTMLGFLEDQLRIVLVRDTAHNAEHAVLAVSLDGEIYILDNTTNSVLPHHQVAHYVPLISFGRRESWGHVPRRLAFPDKPDAGATRSGNLVH